MKKIFLLLLILCFCFYQQAFGASRRYSSKKVITKTQIKAIKRSINARKNIISDDVGEQSSSKSGSKKNVSERVKRQKQIRDVGYKILNSNEVDKRMAFSYSLDYKNPNAYATLKTRRINVNKGLMDMIESDDELAFVLGHEISHAIDSYWGPANGLFYNPQFNFVHRRIETRCDLRSIDFMAKAGYNPVAALIISNKLFAQPVTDIFSSHPMGNRRLATMYVYIKNTYPQFLEENEFTKNPIYKNTLLSCQKNIERLQNKIDAASQDKPEEQN